METSQVVLNQGLTFLAIATGVIVLIAGSFFTKLLFDLSKLTKNLDETTNVLKGGMEPAFKELNSTLKRINTIAENADKNVDSLSRALENIFGAGTLVVNRAKKFSGSFLKGFTKALVGIFKIIIKK